MPKSYLTVAALLLAASVASAGEADVVDVRATREAAGTWHFGVTVRHADEGWNHYADAWEVRTADGKLLATRTLLHPHETEQPFTRSQSGIAIPDGVTQVTVRAHDLVDGWGGREVVVDLTTEQGDRFEIERSG